MKTELTPGQRFGIHRKTGYDPVLIGVPKVKAVAYELVDVSAGKRRIIQRVSRERYALLVYLKKQQQNNQNDLQIQPIY